MRDVALVMMRDLLAHQSEVVALDVEFARDGATTVMFRRSKTDREGRGETRLLAPATVEQMHAAGIQSGPLSLSLNKAGVPIDRLDAGRVSHLLENLAERAGFDPATVSERSCRVGVAQDLVASGKGLVGVMQARRWEAFALIAVVPIGGAGGLGAC